MKKGNKYLYEGKELRILANEESYVMLRYKGCIPFILPLKDFVKLNLVKLN